MSRALLSCWMTFVRVAHGATLLTDDFAYSGGCGHTTAQAEGDKRTMLSTRVRTNEPELLLLHVGNAAACEEGSCSPKLEGLAEAGFAVATFGLVIVNCSRFRREKRTHDGRRSWRCVDGFGRLGSDADCCNAIERMTLSHLWMSTTRWATIRVSRTSRS